MHRLFALRPTALALLLSSAAAAAPPGTRPASTQPSTDPSDRPALEAEQAALPHRPALPIRQILSLSIDHDSINARAVMPPTDGKFGIDVPGWPGFATGQFRADGSWFTFNHFALRDDDNTEINTYVDLRPDYLQLNRTSETPTHFWSMTLIQSQQNVEEAGDAISFTVNDTSKENDNAAAVNLHFRAATATELIRQHPAEMRQYLLPALRDLGAEAVMRASDVDAAWQVLGGRVPVDPTLGKTIDTLLVALDADDFAARTKAEETLVALGPAGAAALRRRDLQSLGPDPKSSVETALRHNEPLSADRAAELSRNLPFLIDALLLDEPRLVTAAAARLKELTGRDPGVAATLPMEQREKRVEAYRAAVAPTTAPASP